MWIVQIALRRPYTFVVLSLLTAILGRLSAQVGDIEHIESQSFIIVTGLPGALAGIVWMLFVTGTTLSVRALNGAIMCMGIATANSIPLVSFAREGLHDGLDAATAAFCVPTLFSYLYRKHRPKSAMQQPSASEPPPATVP